MTTIKSILGWLFGIYKDSQFLQGALLAFIAIHILFAMGAYFYWLIRFIARISA